MPARRVLAVVLAALAFAAPVTAAVGAEAPGAKSGFYGGVSVRQEGLEQGLDFGNVASSFGRFAALENESGARSTSAFGGYRFRNDLALEASVASTAGYRLAGRGGVGLMLPPGADPDGRQLNVDVVGSWSFWRSLSLYGRLGYAQSEIAPAYRTSLATPERRTGDGLEYGVGLRYDFSRALGLKLEYARVGSAAEVERGMMPDVDRLQFGVQYRF